MKIFISSILVLLLASLPIIGIIVTRNFVLTQGEEGALAGSFIILGLAIFAAILSLLVFDNENKKP